MAEAVVMVAFSPLLADPIPAEGRLALAVRDAQLNAQNARTLARISRETATEDRRPVAGATAGGDEQRLRGIPCIARGVAGHVPGTRP